MLLPLLIGIILGALLITAAILNWKSDFRKLARIATRVYCALFTQFNTAYRNNEGLFLLTGIIVSRVYSMKEPVPMNSIAGEVVASGSELVDPSTPLPRVMGYGQAEREQNRELLNFILLLTLLLYRIKRPLDDVQEVSDLVQKHAYEIEYVMSRNLKRTAVSHRLLRFIQEQLAGLSANTIEDILQSGRLN